MVMRLRSANVGADVLVGPSAARRQRLSMIGVCVCTRVAHGKKLRLPQRNLGYKLGLSANVGNNGYKELSEIRVFGLCGP